MKRQLIATLVSGLLALPAFAGPGPNYELYANGFPPFVQPSAKSRAEVRMELIAAQRAGQWVVNGELGTLARPPVIVAGKTRDQVRAELIAAQRDGVTIVNAELGLTARQMYPALYTQGSSDELRAGLRDAGK